MAPSGHANDVAFDGRLYGYSLMEPTYRLRVSDVDGTAAPRDILTGAPEHSIASLVACGSGRVCVLDTNPEQSRVIAVDVVSSREVWRANAPGEMELLVAAGARVVATGRDGLGVVSALFDQDAGRCCARRRSWCGSAPARCSRSATPRSRASTRPPARYGAG